MMTLGDSRLYVTHGCHGAESRVFATAVCDAVNDTKKLFFAKVVMTHVVATDLITALIFGMYYES